MLIQINEAEEYMKKVELDSNEKDYNVMLVQFVNMQMQLAEYHEQVVKH